VYSLVINFLAVVLRLRVIIIIIVNNKNCEAPVTWALYETDYNTVQLETIEVKAKLKWKIQN